MVFSHQSKTTTRQKLNLCINSYDAFHTRHVGPGVKGIIGMHRFNICLVVLLWCENTIAIYYERGPKYLKAYVVCSIWRQVCMVMVT